MSDPHAPTPAPAPHADAAHGHGHAGHAGHHEGHISDQTFIKVFGALLVATLLSFGTNQLIGPGNAVANFSIILLIAIVKAVLVVTFFMHLKIDWRKVFVFIVPTMILAPIVLVVLWPDIVLAWTRFTPTP